ncbi:MAG: RraA family protein [Bryobacteraceae bacterium]
MSVLKSIDRVAPEVLDRLRKLDACTVSNAIERLNVRLRNEGFANSSVRCLTPTLPPMVGYAATGRIRTAAAPTTRQWYYQRMDWWEYLKTIPAPRVVVMQDMDEHPGLGALFGEIHAHISTALDCIGYVTNGTVRDLPGIQRMNFNLFASGVAVSHAYAHVVDFGERVEIGGLPISPGDLLHGDLHGVQCVPATAAAQVPEVAAKLLSDESALIRLCQSPEFSLEEFRTFIEEHET